MTHFVGKGNLAAAPMLKTIRVRDKPVQVAEMRVFFGRYRQDGDGGVEQSGGYWLNVSLYGDKAQSVQQHLQKGMRVKVEGSLTEYSLDGDTDDTPPRFQIQADDVTLVLSRIDSIAFTPRESSAAVA